ncbi:hypothetical protein [Thalassotalea marina]|uniref:Uncharacterized protein n=1 Tax=Thalassotalea marina TaxID=1673741 RepID=A0A919BQ29_9GAMM|nr:hypothetical protein [Thalassotalea marina]GHG03741.1 hypothetical protein GCM10017161_36280 [Thalassotalea marina]
MLKIAYFMLALALLILIGTLTESFSYAKQRETALKLCGSEENIAYVDSDTVMCKRDEVIGNSDKE